MTKYILYRTGCSWNKEATLAKYPELQKLDISMDEDFLYINSNNLEETLSDINECCNQPQFVVDINDRRIEIYDDYRE